MRRSSDRFGGSRVAHEIREPRQQQVRLVTELFADLTSVRRFERLEPPPVFRCLLRPEHGDGEEKAVAAVAAECGRGEQLRHGEIVPEDRRAHTA
jgi:hypothetical protein